MRSAASSSHPIIGILGGMGPEATLDLMRRVVAATPAACDEDHIHMIVDNNPKVPSRIAAIIEKTGTDPAPELIRMAKGLEAAGASILAMPCNTAHAYAQKISASVSIPFLNMITLTAKRLSAMNLQHRRVGLLASRAVKIMGLYEKALAPYDISLIYPKQENRVMDIIMAVKKGEGTSNRKALVQIADELKKEQIDLLLVACTELSILADSLQDVPIIDALDVLAKEIVVFGFAERALQPQVLRKEAKNIKNKPINLKEWSAKT
jgi:aspartate racemase